MRIGVQGNAVRSQLADLHDRSREALRRLPGKPVDQVGVDGHVAQAAGALHQLANHVEGLDAMDGLLHIRIEILHAEAEPIEAEGAKVGQAVGRHGARVHLDRHLGVGRQAESG